MHARIFFSKALRQSPMSSSAFPVKQAGRRNQAHTRTYARDRYPTTAPALQPGHDRCVAFDHVVDAQPCRRNKSEIGLANVAESHVGPNLNPAIAIHGSAIR